MSVYKEAWWIIKQIRRNSRQIFPDAADYGAPTKKGDEVWKLAAQLVSMYGDEGTRRVERYETGHHASQNITIADEAHKKWHTYRVEFTAGNIPGFDGFIEVNELTAFDREV